MLSQQMKIMLKLILVLLAWATWDHKLQAYRLGDVDIWFHHKDLSRVSRLPAKNMNDQVIYQVFVDRFYNGNRSNDCVQFGAFCAQGQHDFDDWYRYQGGDLRGVIEKLDYLQSLGINRLWLTPIFENQYVAERKQLFGRWVNVTSYHGYWLRDWFRLNPFFTDRGPDDYTLISELMKEASQRGIKIYFDTVTNHTGPLNPLIPPTKIKVQSPMPFKDHETQGSKGQRAALYQQGQWVMSYDDDKKRMQQQANYRPMFHHFEKNIGEVHGESDWSDPFILENYNLMGLADLDQTNPQVREYFFKAHQFWLAQQPQLQGFRVDTIKHVPLVYWQEFGRQLRQLKPEIELIGEYYNGGALHEESYAFYHTTPMTMFDFDFREMLRRVFLLDDSFEKIIDLWRQDPVLWDATQLVTFLDNHDQKRLRGEGLGPKRMRLAIALWLASRGVPCLYYGIEQDLFYEGDPGDPFNRPMMKQFDLSNTWFLFFKYFIKLRHRAPSLLQEGQTHVIHLTKNIMAFERTWHGKVLVLVLSKNPRLGSDVLTIKGTSLADGVYLDELAHKSYEVREGNFEVALSYGDLVVIKNF